MRIERLADSAAIPACSILFVGAAAVDRLDSILRQVAGRPVLLIGDNPGLARRGVAVIFYLQRGRVRFEINPNALRQAGLTAEAQLLRQSTRMLYPDDAAYERLGSAAYPLLARGEAYRTDLALQRKDGSQFWARLVGQAIDPAAGESIWIVDDIDREKALERELRRAGAAADTTSRAKEEPQARLGFEVLDSGIGIPQEQQAELFEAFTQVDSSQSRTQRGSGLGLTISSRLVALMGGTLELESEPGVGSRFWFSLTFARGADPALESPVAPELGGLAGIQVLVAEDDPINQLTTRRLLEGQGIAVTLVNTGRKAV